MIVNRELALIASILDKKDATSVLTKGVQADWFPTHSDIFEFIINYCSEYKQVPPQDVVHSKFPDLDFSSVPEGVKEAEWDYLIDELRQHNLETGMRQAVVAVNDFLIGEKEGNWFEIFNEFRDHLDSVSRKVNLLTDVDLINEWEPRFDEFILKTQDQSFLSTGFPTIDEKVGGFSKLGGHVWIVMGRFSMGKALALDTPIPTINGWKNMEDIQVGDRVFDEKGNPCNVTFVTDIMHNRECYRVTFSDHSSMVADAEHQWLVETHKSRKSVTGRKLLVRKGEFQGIKSKNQEYKMAKPQILTTEQMKDSVDYTLSKATGQKVHNYSIPLAGEVLYPMKNQLVHPYVLGYWLGDGTCANGNITTADEEVVDRFRGFGYDVAKQSYNDYGYTVYGLMVELRDKLEVLNNKHIPENYMLGNIEQRLELLKGLMDSDGYVDKYGNCHFSSSNKVLADQTLELVRSLGIKATQAVKVPTLNGIKHKPSFMVNFSTDLPVFHLRRKAQRQDQKINKSCSRTKRKYITSIKKVDSVPVKCIQVDSDSHLYLAGGAFTPTHNTWIAGKMGAAVAKQGETVLHVSLEMNENENGYRNDTMMSNMLDGDTFRNRSLNRGEEIDALAYQRWLQNLSKEVPGKYIVVTPKGNMGFGLNNIAAKIEMYKPTLVIIDYIQLLTGPDWKVIAEYTSKLKLMAESYSTTIIEVAQEGRPPKDSADSSPSEDRIAQGDTIGRDADKILSIQRKKKSDDPTARIFFMKDRQGEGHFDFPINWFPNTGNFDEIEEDSGGKNFVDFTKEKED